MLRSNLAMKDRKIQDYEKKLVKSDQEVEERLLATVSNAISSPS